jgi:shikimate kinase
MIILLMGPPGSGKTSIGRRLAKSLNYTWIDVDDHVLEPEWKCSVSEKLFQLGEKRFLKVLSSKVIIDQGQK